MIRLHDAKTIHSRRTGDGSISYPLSVDKHPPIAPVAIAAELVNIAPDSADSTLDTAADCIAPVDWTIGTDTDCKLFVVAAAGNAVAAEVAETAGCTDDYPTFWF